MLGEGVTTLATTTGRPAATGVRAETEHRTRSGLLSGGRSRTFGLVAAAGILACLALGSVMIGNFSVHLSDVVGALSHGPETDVERVVRHVRIPRTVTGLLAGTALGVAGAVMQGLTRNPLAGPGLLGVNSGAALAIVLAMTTFGITTAAGYLWFAFAGAAVAAVLVYALGSLGSGGYQLVRSASLEPPAPGP